jgi:hypothetical protein
VPKQQSSSSSDYRVVFAPRDIVEVRCEDAPGDWAWYRARVLVKFGRSNTYAVSFFDGRPRCNVDPERVRAPANLDECVSYAQLACTCTTCNHTFVAVSVLSVPSASDVTCPACHAVHDVDSVSTTRLLANKTTTTTTTSADDDIVATPNVVRCYISDDSDNDADNHEDETTDDDDNDCS